MGMEANKNTSNIAKAPQKINCSTIYLWHTAKLTMVNLLNY